ncbi:MAG: MmgE/PrpD family protein [Pseudomonadota bacterium]
MQLEETIARRVASLSFEGIDADLLHVLKRNIMDSYAAICGSLLDKGMLANFDRLVSGPASGSDLDVWGIQKRGSFLDAIFMNALLARRSDLLSTYLSANAMGGAHPSDNVGLVLTLADWKKMSGKELLSTIYTAFYLSAAFATYYDPEPAKHDHDATAIFYTALTIGYALGLSEEKLVMVQRLAGMFGLDINQAGVGQMTDWKHCTYASGALRGFQSIKLALAGFQAPSEIYEGSAGVNQFFSHSEVIFDPPPDLTRIIFKRWPALVFCQTPIDVALDISKKIKDKNTIQSILVKTYAVAFRNGALPTAYHPTSRAGRTHSIPYCVATALLKPVKYEDFDEPHASDGSLNRLMAKVKVVEDTEIDKLFPAKSKCVIAVTLKDGSTIQAERDCPKGDPNDPLSDREIEEKLSDYFFFAANKAEQDEVIERLWKLEEQTSLDWLVAPLKRRLI